MNRLCLHPRPLALMGLAAALTSGCAGRTIEIRPGVGAVDEGPSAEMDWSDWGLILSRVVTGDKVNYDRLLENRRFLDRFLWRVGRVGPQTTPARFPDPQNRLAYAINCYNATILRAVVELAQGGEAPGTIPSDLGVRFRCRIDGRLQSPADLRRAAEALAGDDWRVRLALCSARRVGPPLPRRVFLGELLDAQLNQAARAALLSPQVVRIDHGERKRLLVWRGVYDRRDRLVREFEERLNTRDAELLNVLLEWSDRPRREVLNSAVGYPVVRMPDDSRSNALEPAPVESRDLLSVLRSIGSFSFLRP